MLFSSLVHLSETRGPENQRSSSITYRVVLAKSWIALNLNLFTWKLQDALTDWKTFSSSEILRFWNGVWPSDNALWGRADGIKDACDSEETSELPARSREFRNEGEIVFTCSLRRQKVWLEFYHRMGLYSSYRKGNLTQYLGSQIQSLKTWFQILSTWFQILSLIYYLCDPGLVTLPCQASTSLWAKWWWWVWACV